MTDRTIYIFNFVLWSKTNTVIILFFILVIHAHRRARAQHIIYINVIPALYYMHLGLVLFLTNSYPLYFLDRELIDTGISNRVFVIRKNHVLRFFNPHSYFLLFAFISILIIRLINASQCAHALISSANRHDLVDSWYCKDIYIFICSINAVHLLCLNIIS